MHDLEKCPSRLNRLIAEHINKLINGNYQNNYTTTEFEYYNYLLTTFWQIALTLID